jgi:hypothetical protein
MMTKMLSLPYISYFHMPLSYDPALSMKLKNDAGIQITQEE